MRDDYRAPAPPSTFRSRLLPPGARIRVSFVAREECPRSASRALLIAAPRREFFDISIPANAGWPLRAGRERTNAAAEKGNYRAELP